MTESPDLGVVHYGLGPIGRSIASMVADHDALHSCAAIDSDESLVGHRLGELIGADGARGTPRIVRRLRDAKVEGAAIALHCTGSRLAQVLPQLLELVDLGLDVVSTCEELSYPCSGTAEAATQLHESAVVNGVTVLGTGVNPGFAMDYLPIVLAGVTRRVDRVRVTRVADAGKRRLPLQHKVGVGLTSDEFHRRVAAGRLGHVGLHQSAEAIAAGFGWRLEDVDEIIEPVLAPALTSGSFGSIPKNGVIGLHQVGRGRCGSDVRIELDLTLALDVGSDFDMVVLDGVPPIEMRIPGGLQGDIATAAIVVNAIPHVLRAPSGLVTMADMAPPHPWTSLGASWPATVSCG